MRVLIVEPNPLFFEILETGFIAAGVIVYRANDLKSAYKILADNNIEFITVSYYLDNGNHIDLVNYVRNKMEMKVLPIYLITAELSTEILGLAYSKGVTGVFNKSDLAGLFRSVERVITIQNKKFKGRVLLVEDIMSIALLEIAQLEALGFVVDHCVEIKKANRLIEKNYESYKLVILDLILEQGECGSTLISTIRCHHNQIISTLPILVTTGFDDPARRIDLFNLGADDYIIKPVFKEELICRVDHLITQKNNMDNLNMRKKILEEYALIDPTSQIFNRYGFRESSEKLLNYAKRNKHDCILVLIDMDDFKSINDRLGHNQGDECIKIIGGILKGNLRDHDVVGRWGGDEFIALLVNCSKLNAQNWFKRVAELYQNKMQELSIKEEGISGGYSVINHLGLTVDFEQSVEIADKGLYKAKKSGGARMCEFRE
ncbi:MAG: diguanylate cyclase [Saccharospirillaceae bacterium]|nr:diguanylate cyclase [Pseudomonadales bacterium]NRB81752.1 diguanylate cyclase [Saccharospirillaceae bacterium]